MFLVVFIINLLSISWMQIEQNLQGKKSGKVQKVESIGERKNTEPIEIFSFYWRILCRRLALMHQGRVCVDISPICVRVWSCVIRMLQTDPRGDYCVPVFSLPASKQTIQAYLALLWWRRIVQKRKDDVQQCLLLGMPYLDLCLSSKYMQVNWGSNFTRCINWWHHVVSQRKCPFTHKRIDFRGRLFHEE